MKSSNGFTLIELMLALIIMGILATIAAGSYRSYTLNASASEVQQEILELSVLLERHRSRNYSYNGFDLNDYYTGVANASSTNLNVPINSTTAKAKYVISLRQSSANDVSLLNSASNGRTWAILAKSNDSDNFSFLMTSTGIQCRNKAASLINFQGCGVGSEDW